MGQAGGIKTNNIVVLAKIGAPFGVQGWVHLQSHTSPKDNILSYQNWYIKKRKEDWQPIQMKQLRVHGKEFVALLEGVTNRDEAGRLTHAELGIRREDLPDLEEGEHYWQDLIGLDVFTETGVYLGRVDSLFETGSNDVLVVKEIRERLIPFIPDEVILKVDLQAKTLVVRWDPEF